MNCRLSRQVLDCSDGVFGVTALAVAALKIVKRASDTAIPPQSGDFEDSVAALQDADALVVAPLRFMAPDARPMLEVEALQEPKGRASSPLRADDCNYDSPQCKGRRARSDAPYVSQLVRGTNACQEMETFHEQ